MKISPTGKAASDLRSPSVSVTGRSSLLAEVIVPEMRVVELLRWFDQNGFGQRDVVRVDCGPFV